MNDQDRKLMEAQFSANRYMDSRVACNPKPKVHHKRAMPDVRPRTFSSDSSASNYSGSSLSASSTASSTASVKSTASSMFDKVFHKHKTVQPQRRVHFA